MKAATELSADDLALLSRLKGRNCEIPGVCWEFLPHTFIDYDRLSRSRERRWVEWADGWQQLSLQCQAFVELVCGWTSVKMFWFLQLWKITKKKGATQWVVKLYTLRATPWVRSRRGVTKPLLQGENNLGTCECCFHVWACMSILLGEKSCVGRSHHARHHAMQCCKSVHVSRALNPDSVIPATRFRRLHSRSWSHVWANGLKTEPAFCMLLRRLHICGVGWGGIITYMPRCCHVFFCTVPQTSCDAAAMFSCTVPHTSCYAAAMFSCTVPHTSCYAAAMLSCAVAHTSCYAAALFPCTVPHTSCYAAAMFSCAVAVVHTSCYAAALFPCTVAHTSCYAAAMFWKPKMPKIQTAWIKRFGSMFECSSSGAGKTQIAATWASSPPPRTWSTLCEEKNARRCCFIQNHFKMGSQNFKKFLTSKHMKMT